MESCIITKDNTQAVAEMERFAASHANAHFLQQPRWAQVKDHWQWRGILAYEEGVPVGVMSVLIRPLPLGFSLMYAPRGPVCDRSDPCVMAALLSGADAVAEEVKALELLLDPDEPDGNRSFREMMEAWDFGEREDPGFGNIQAQHVFRLFLRGHTEESLLAQLSQKTRYNLRLAQRKGVQIQAYPGNRRVPEDALEAFSCIMEQTGQRDHFIPRKRSYYKKVMEVMGEDAVLYLAVLDGEPIAGTIGLFTGGKSWYLYGASADAHRDAMPNYLLQWQMICTGLERGCVFYDLRGVPREMIEGDSLQGLYRFKKGFGGTFCKFTGLFVRRYRPLFASCFELAMGVYRRVLRRKIRK